VYRNAGDKALGVPAHWHYISYGCSDIHGNGNVHKPVQNCEEKSGFGMEFTFRLVYNNEESAPMWPARMMNTLAKYMYTQKVAINVGDFVPSVIEQGSPIDHVIATRDPQFGSLQSKYGRVEFVQLVGISKAELQAVQMWRSAAVFNMLRVFSPTVSQYFCTDLQRPWVLRRHKLTQARLAQGSAHYGSNMGYLTGTFRVTALGELERSAASDAAAAQLRAHTQGAPFSVALSGKMTLQLDWTTLRMIVRGVLAGRLLTHRRPFLFVSTGDFQGSMDQKRQEQLALFTGGCQSPGRPFPPLFCSKAMPIVTLGGGAHQVFLSQHACHILYTGLRQLVQRNNPVLPMSICFEAVGGSSNQLLEFRVVELDSSLNDQAKQHKKQ
jgi:hypothetical protein